MTPPFKRDTHTRAVHIHAHTQAVYSLCTICPRPLSLRHFNCHFIHVFYLWISLWRLKTTLMFLTLVFDFLHKISEAPCYCCPSTLQSVCLKHSALCYHFKNSFIQSEGQYVQKHRLAFFYYLCSPVLSLSSKSWCLIIKWKKFAGHILCFWHCACVFCMNF